MSQIKPKRTHLCQQEAQTELVMLILLRLAEDVITFQTLPPQRRRDIQQTLTQNMDSIFSFMMAILRIYVEDHRKAVSGVLLYIPNKSGTAWRTVFCIEHIFSFFSFSHRKPHQGMNCR